MVRYQPAARPSNRWGPGRTRVLDQMEARPGGATVTLRKVALDSDTQVGM